MYISIIVPVYNVEKYLDRCVNSLINQTLFDIEIILINDGSTDKSGKICDAFALSDERIKVIHKENAGQGLARNEGLKIAQGEYVTFVDADDYLRLDAMEIAYEEADKDKVDLCCYGYEILNGKGELVYRPNLITGIYEGNQIANRFIFHYFGDSADDDTLRGVSACMSLFRNAIIKEKNLCFHSERVIMSEDTIFSLDFCKMAKKVKVIAKYLYYYCQKDDSFSQGYRPDRLANTEKLCDILTGYAEEFGVGKEVEKRINMLYWITVIAHLKQIMRSNTLVSKKDIREKITEICDDRYLREIMLELKKINLPLKQKIYRLAIQLKLVGVIIFMTKIRMKKGL